MKLMIKTTNEHIKHDCLAIFQQVAFNDDNMYIADKIIIADNFIKTIKMDNEYITIKFRKQKYYHSGVVTFHIKKSAIENFEVIQ